MFVLYRVTKRLQVGECFTGTCVRVRAEHLTDRNTCSGDQMNNLCVCVQQLGGMKEYLGEVGTFFFESGRTSEEEHPKPYAFLTFCMDAWICYIKSVCFM